MSQEQPSERSCTKCGEVKPLEAFSPRKNRKSGYASCCKECNRLAARKRRATDAESSREACRRYYWANREWFRERRRRYYEANAEALREYGRQFYAAEYREQSLENSREWRQNNREAHRASRRKTGLKRRAQKLALPHEDIDPFAIFERDKGVCGICGERVERDTFHLDHIVPLAHGGPHRHDNVQVAHPWCNLNKGATPP